MTDAPRPRCAVLGSPIAHSLSPVLHRAAYEALGLDWEYLTREVVEADLAGFLDGLEATGEDWRGLSLTMPLKRAVVPLLDEMSERAGQARAVNTVVLSGRRRVGHNTDIPGASSALRERYDGPVRSAVVLGGGATATSTLLGLADLGCRRVTLLVRDPARARETVEAAARHPRPPAVEVDVLGGPARSADVLVSTIPAAAQTERVLAAVDDVPVVFEVLYDPWPTPLAARAAAQGRTLVAGLDLLVHQAALQVELMTGAGSAPLAQMRAAGERELAARSR
ncbi:MAG: shikimate dehydrogenase [Nocardioides sp.]